MLVEPIDNNYELSVSLENVNVAKLAHALAVEFAESHSNVEHFLSENIDTPTLSCRRGTKALKKLACNGGRGLLSHSDRNVKMEVVAAYTNMKVFNNPTIILTSFNNSRHWYNFLTSKGLRVGILRYNKTPVKGVKPTMEITDEYDVYLTNESTICSVAYPHIFNMLEKGHFFLVLDNFETYCSNMHMSFKSSIVSNIIEMNFSCLFLSNSTPSTCLSWYAKDMIGALVWTEQQATVLNECTTRFQQYRFNMTYRDSEIDKKALIDIKETTAALKETGLII